jgi:hypothetical protein
MRILSLLLATLLFAPNTLAQDYAIDKGSYLLGGSFQLDSSGDSRDDDDDRRTLLSIGSGVSYFIVPGLALGANAQFSRFSEGGSSSSSFSAGPQIAYYFGGPSSTFFPVVSGRADYGDFGDLSRVGADLAGGATFMAARNVGISAEAFYQTYRYSRDNNRGDFTHDSFGIRGGVTVFIF